MILIILPNTVFSLDLKLEANTSSDHAISIVDDRIELISILGQVHDVCVRTVIRPVPRRGHTTGRRL